MSKAPEQAELVAPPTRQALGPDHLESMLKAAGGKLTGEIRSRYTMPLSIKTPKLAREYVKNNYPPVAPTAPAPTPRPVGGTMKGGRKMAKQKKKAPKPTGHDEALVIHERPDGAQEVIGVVDASLVDMTEGPEGPHSFRCERVKAKYQ